MEDQSTFVGSDYRCGGEVYMGDLPLILVCCDYRILLKVSVPV